MEEQYYKKVEKLAEGVATMEPVSLEEICAENGLVKGSGLRTSLFCLKQHMNSVENGGDALDLIPIIDAMIEAIDLPPPPSEDAELKPNFEVGDFVSHRNNRDYKYVISSICSGSSGLCKLKNIGNDIKYLAHIDDLLHWKDE